MKLGVICEGPTDFHVLKHTIQAYLDPIQIRDIQPPLNAQQTQIASDAWGGWEKVSEYLKSEDFLILLENMDYVVIQIDTDVCEHRNFNVSPISLANNDHNLFYDAVKQKLLEWIDSAGIPFNKKKAKRFIHYQNLRNRKISISYIDKIIFAISVHSLECWLLAYHDTRPRRCKITGCENALTRYLSSVGKTINKNAKDYIQHSLDFKDVRNHPQISNKSESFKIFVEQLATISA
ncbi:hypothetical protein MKL42_06330 [Acinetobacter sp. AOR15_HL]|uniref:hypothetical protein n=1 Tax=unclassified Acinetobacter TaxID=196816 RepID=UPI0022EAE67B|nr:MULTISPECIES: hypothetical protein [unclassified Acinetobacter]MDA3557122.1 hypothetical protein [Acinetobacter sp. AOR15_HL]MDA3572731.1 hypothetical protein [Acinetobacter sp. AOR14_HL]